MTGEEKKKRDPIFATCFVIFVLAAAGVLGVFVNEHYLSDDKGVVAYGDKVSVNYVGTFYDYIGEKNAVVFDTSRSSVGNNDSIIKSNSFSATSFKDTYSVTIGSKGSLEQFENCLVGHKVGDKVRVAIENGYPAGSEPVEVSAGAIALPVTETMSKTKFSELYDYSLTAGGATIIETVYGWSAVATLDSATSTVTITNTPEAGKQYTYSNGDDDKHTFGTVSITVNSVQSGTINCAVTLKDYKTVDVSSSEIQMIEFVIEGQTVYITNYDGSTLTYKTCKETSNQKLYFEIEILSINS